MQVYPVALPLDLIDVAFAVVLATGLEGEQLGVPRERLEGCQRWRALPRDCHPKVA
jgi:hypothetical protein